MREGGNARLVGGRGDLGGRQRGDAAVVQHAPSRVIARSSLRGHVTIRCHCCRPLPAALLPVFAASITTTPPTRLSNGAGSRRQPHRLQEHPVLAKALGKPSRVGDAGPVPPKTLRGKALRAWAMLEVRPDWISCLCRNTVMRAAPRPSSRLGRPRAPALSTAISVLFPLSAPPATARARALGFQGLGF